MNDGFSIEQSRLVKDGRFHLRRDGHWIASGPLTTLAQHVQAGDVVRLSVADYRVYRAAIVKRMVSA